MQSSITANNSFVQSHHYYMVQPEEIKLEDVLSLQDMRCPLSGKIMTQPMQLIPCGHHVEQSAMRKWYCDKKAKICPIATCSKPYTSMLENSIFRKILTNFNNKIQQPTDVLKQKIMELYKNLPDSLDTQTVKSAINMFFQGKIEEGLEIITNVITASANGEIYASIFNDMSDHLNQVNQRKITWGQSIPQTPMYAYEMGFPSPMGPLSTRRTYVTPPPILLTDKTSGSQLSREETNGVDLVPSPITTNEELSMSSSQELSSKKRKAPYDSPDSDQSTPRKRVRLTFKEPAAPKTPESGFYEIPQTPESENLEVSKTTGTEQVILAQIFDSSTSLANTNQLSASDKDVIPSECGDENAMETLQEVHNGYTPEVGTDERNLIEAFKKNTKIQETYNFIRKVKNMNIHDEEGNTPLHLLILNYTKVIKLIGSLVSKGASVNAQNVKGETPLHQAAEMGKSEAIKELIKKGANRNIRNNAGKYPKDVALHLSDKETLEPQYAD